MTVESKFQDRSARVILVDSSGSVRQLLTESMKDLGFNNAQSVTSIEDAHNILETESADWLLVPLSADQAVNGLHTVRMVVNFAELHNVKVSLLIEESESYVLSSAFEFGLFSYHLKPFTKDKLRKEFDELLMIFESTGWNSTLTSANYLRKHLRNAGQWQDLLAFEKALLEIYPGNTDLLLHLAEALHHSGAKKLAQSTLHQVEYINPGAADKVKEKWTALFGDEVAFDSKSEQVANTLGINSAVLIDSDSAVTNYLKGVLTEIGCPEILDFSDGEVAFDAIKSKPEPSLIIMEWRLSKLSGPLLIQRIRSHGFVNVPIIILSSLLKPADMGLVREMGVANIALKPADRESILKSIIWTIQQDRMPFDVQSLETKIRALFVQRKISAAEEMLTRYFNTPSIGASRKAVMKSEYALAKGNYIEARDLAIDAIKLGGDSIFALNVLGKSLMALRQFDAALKCFKKAQSMSPSNFERLVTIAEVHAELEQASEAQEAINKAKDIDPGSFTVKEGEVKVALSGGDTAKAQQLLGQMESMSNVISYLNNKAVANSRCGFTDEGILLYQQTLAAIPENKKEILAIVAYNLALARIRKGDVEGGVKDLNTVIALGEARIQSKAKNLKERINSLKDGQTLILKESERPHELANPAESLAAGSTYTVASAESLITRILELSPGDHCCYLLFKATTSHPPALEKILAIPPKFKARKTLERGETFAGTDGTKLAS